MPDTALLPQYLHRDSPTIAYGRGVFLYDTEGRRYLDGSGGPMTVSIGHAVPEIIAAITAQHEKVAFAFRTQFTNEPAEELARRLCAVAPGDLNSVYFVGSGSEATEYAMRTALGYWRELGQPRKEKIVSRRISYHGMTLGALSMSGHTARRADAGSLLHGFPVAPPAYAYRYAHEGETEAQYAARAAAELEAAIVEADPATVAAVIVEPIVGAAGGALVPPSGYLRAVREACDRQGVLLILDEVITGMGRTGQWFACDDEGVVPDLLAAAKGLSGGYAPLGAVLMRDHIVEAFRNGSGMAPLGHTFSSNPVSAAACLAVLDYIETHDVLANARARGAQLEAGLRELASRYPFMADVRGRGMLWGFEFVVDPATREAPDPSHAVSATFIDVCFARGLLVYPAGIAPLNNAVIISPPLTITEDEVQLLLGLLDESLAAMAELPYLS